uniref:Uncharacterized protein n=1 Tax=viral metagenome TaxID=1070528 RepID=A0A6M3L8M0_9ZZZZ
MATAKCEIAGFEGVTVEWPDEFTMRHESIYRRGQDRAWSAFRDSVKDGEGDESLIPSGAEMVAFGVFQLATVTGLDIDLKALTINGLWDLPRHYSGVLGWIANTVGAAYQRSGEVPKNS